MQKIRMPTAYLIKQSHSDWNLFNKKTVVATNNINGISLKVIREHQIKPKFKKIGANRNVFVVFFLITIARTIKQTPAKILEDK